jgi:predicted transcriptional regulator
MNQINIISQISNLKSIDYRNTLAISTLIELLIEKEIITRHEFAKKAQYLDNLSLEELKEVRACIK